MFDLSIVILHHNTPSFVEANLQALKAAILPSKTKIIVVNNGANSANQKINSSSYTGLDVSFFETPNHGFAAGNNFGYKQAEAKYYAFINPDIEVQPNTIQILLDYMQDNSHIGIVSPQLIYPDGSIQDNYRVFPRILDLIIKRIPFLLKNFSSRMRRYLMWDRNPDKSEAVDWVTGAFTLVSAQCMQAINSHDERYFLFMSDVALCREAYYKGFETHIVGTAKCLHNDQRASSGGIKDIFRKKTVRIHILDAIKYFWHYKFKSLPKNAPSQNLSSRKDSL